MTLKKLAVFAIVTALLVAAVQAMMVIVNYTQVRSELDDLILRYEELGQDQFRAELVSALDRLDVHILPEQITIEEDRMQRAVRVEINYTKEFQLLSVPFEKQMRVWRTAYNLSFGP